MTTQMHSIDPANVAAYLAARGWTREQSFNESKASLWLAPGDVATDVLLPLRQGFADYQLRMGALVDTVARVEGRSPYEVLRDFAMADADIIRVRIATEDSRGATTLPFIDGVNVLKKIRDVLIAAALATLEKRAFFTNRDPEIVRDFLMQLQLGQTEYSSFVFTVVSPLGEAAALRGSDADQPQEPFGRRVTYTLMHALKAMEDAAAAAAREGNVNPILGTVADGVSANLCDAVVELQEICGNRPVEFSVNWAATRQPPEDAVSSVVLHHDRVSQLEAASDAIWGMPKRFDFRVNGMVKELVEGSENTALLLGYVDGVPHVIRATFSPQIYSEVTHAFRDRLMIRCEGDLIREVGAFILKNARYFQIIEHAGAD